MIPPEKSAAVTRALQGRGANPVFRIVVRGSAFLLRINLRAGDLTRHYTCMRAAAKVGLAPCVWYTSIEDRISITDFVETVPFPVTEALVRIPTALRTLHALPPFLGVPNHINSSCMFLMHKGAAVDAFVQGFQEANILPQADTQELFARYAQVAAAYPHHDPDMVSSHNDLFKPDNMLFDGHRLWLVDWEAAFLNDRYADLAVVANFVITNDAQESAYLQEYFGKPPDEYQLARFFLMRQLAHIFYAMVFLLLGSSGARINWSEAVPEFEDFHRRIWAGEVKLSDQHTKIVYGRVHWERLLKNARQARYNEALRIVSDRNRAP